ncbi:MAG TPA: DUF5063 domain-containing protein [Terricaulis sp.]|nr:DUF5063 domain-containing protein [Terricaulis sp.]
MSSTHAWDDFVESAQELSALIARAGSLTPEDRQRDLIAALSGLELRCLALPQVEPVDAAGGESPNTHLRWRDAIASAFPEFGLYHSIRPSPASEPESATLSDAVNGLADIMRDIDDALWENGAHGRESGIWQAKFNYEHHLGSHLADLRSYLYRLRFFGP